MPVMFIFLKRKKIVYEHSDVSYDLLYKALVKNTH